MKKLLIASTAVAAVLASSAALAATTHKLETVVYNFTNSPMKVTAQQGINGGQVYDQKTIAAGSLATIDMGPQGSLSGEDLHISYKMGGTTPAKVSDVILVKNTVLPSKVTTDLPSFNIVPQGRNGLPMTIYGTAGYQGDFQITNHYAK